MMKVYLQDVHHHKLQGFFWKILTLYGLILTCGMRQKQSVREKQQCVCCRSIYTTVPYVLLISWYVGMARGVATQFVPSLWTRIKSRFGRDSFKSTEILNKVFDVTFLVNEFSEFSPKKKN